MTDHVYSYLFEHAPIRVQVVQMSQAWQAMHSAHGLPDLVTHMLGRCAAATALLATSIKFEGRISVQMQSDGPLHLLLCQATHDLGLRGMAKLASAQPLPAQAGMADLVGNGHIAVTIENMRDDKRYQGITPVVCNNLASSFEHYFAQSEQLPTRLWLAADDKVAAGLMLQRMPGVDTDDDAWQRAQKLAETVTDNELLTLTPDELIHRLLHEEDLRRFDPRPLRFRCNCSKNRVGKMLNSLGEAEVSSILEEQGQVEVTCEFCGRSYLFDGVDAAGLFTQTPLTSDPELLQ